MHRADSLNALAFDGFVLNCGILEVISGQLSIGMIVGTIHLTTANTIQWNDVGARWSVIGMAHN